MHVCAPTMHLRRRAHTSILCVYFHSYGFLLAKTDVGETHKIRAEACTIITVILIKVSNCDPLIFPRCWLHCNAVTTSITKLQPVINLHIIYMFLHQHTANPNPKITATWTGKPIPLSNLNIFLPHPPILTWHNDEACLLHVRYVWMCNSPLTCSTQNSQNYLFVASMQGHCDPRYCFSYFLVKSIHKIQIRQTHTVPLKAFVRMRKYSNLLCHFLRVL